MNIGKTATIITSMISLVMALITDGGVGMFFYVFAWSFLFVLGAVIFLDGFISLFK